MRQLVLEVANESETVNSLREPREGANKSGWLPAVGQLPVPARVMLPRADPRARCPTIRSQRDRGDERRASKSIVYLPDPLPPFIYFPFHLASPSLLYPFLPWLFAVAGLDLVNSARSFSPLHLYP